MPHKKREPDKKHAAAARGRRVPLDQLMANPALPASMEAAWVRWSEAMRNVDTRTMLLLRAAFQAGYEAGR